MEILPDSGKLHSFQFPYYTHAWFLFKNNKIQQYQQGIVNNLTQTLKFQIYTHSFPKQVCLKSFIFFNNNKNYCVYILGI